jgi:hypothetical protein
MKEINREQIANFWRFHRPARDAAQALNIPLAEVEAIYEELVTAQNLREALLKTLVHRLKALALLLLFATPLLRAQSVSPVATEVGGKKSEAQGNFTITNNSIIPLTVILEQPQQLTFESGKPKLSPLSPGVHLELSEQSARLGARQQHSFWWKLVCEKRPCAVTLWSTLTGAHTNTGLSVAIHLPTSIYFCQQAKNCRASVMKEGQP